MRDSGEQRNPLIIERNRHHFQYNKHNMLPVSRDLANIINNSNK